MGKGDIAGRLRRLEERADEEGRGFSEEQKKERWLCQMGAPPVRGYRRTRLPQDA